jgi:RNA binding exosome subunit
MTTVNIASAEIEILIHATEDGVKVLSAVGRVLSIDPGEFSADTVRGHFGNEITRLKAIVSNRRATEIASKIIESMSDEDRLLMHDNFDLYTDGKNSIYIRISKQKLFDGKVALDQADPLKIRLKVVHRFQAKSELENYRNLLVKDGFS